MGLDTMKKLLHLSAISSTPSGAGIWCGSLSISFLSGSCSVYATHLMVSAMALHHL